MTGKMYKNHTSVLEKYMPHLLFRSVRIEGVGDSWRFKQQPVVIPDKHFTVLS